MPCIVRAELRILNFKWQKILKIFIYLEEYNCTFDQNQERHVCVFDSIRFDSRKVCEKLLMGRKIIDCRYWHVLLFLLFWTDWPIHTNFQLRFLEFVFRYFVDSWLHFNDLGHTHRRKIKTQSESIQLYGERVYFASFFYFLRFLSPRRMNFEFIHNVFTWLSSSPGLTLYLDFDCVECWILHRIQTTGQSHLHTSVGSKVLHLLIA